MLVLTRKNREAIVVGDCGGNAQIVKVTVLEICAGRVKLGFEASTDVPIHRAEVWERIRMEEGTDLPAPNQSQFASELRSYG